jgi:ribonuclease BN (tRNA processing enzyme)
MRSEPLPIVGPSGNDVAPDLATFLNRMFDAKTGAFQVLGSTLGAVQPGTERPRLDVNIVDVTKTEPTKVLDRDGMTVTAFRIPHANMPTLAYRVQTRDVSVVFSSDQNGSDPRFVDFAKGANVLVMHLAIAAGAPPNPLHAPPAVVGRIAQETGTKRLILGHIGQFDLDAAIADVRKSYTGALTVGADLQCTPVQ